MTHIRTLAALLLAALLVVAGCSDDDSEPSSSSSSSTSTTEVSTDEEASAEPGQRHWLYYFTGFYIHDLVDAEAADGDGEVAGEDGGGSGGEKDDGGGGEPVETFEPSHNVEPTESEIPMYEG